MEMRPHPWYLLLFVTLLGRSWMDAQATPPSASDNSAQDAMNRDLLEVTIPELAIQMPPPDETMPQDGQISTGPHSDTSWVNMIGVPAVVVPGGFYPDGLPFGLEISARPWKDGDLLGWAYAYEQATRHRRPPVLVEKGLLPDAR
jgi:Asp-tRNA(Asn)/Glu-tRNA(Gln) amidotransferase A subunit family amidase